MDGGEVDRDGGPDQARELAHRVDPGEDESTGTYEQAFADMIRAVLGSPTAPVAEPRTTASPEDGQPGPADITKNLRATQAADGMAVESGIWAASTFENENARWSTTAVRRTDTADNFMASAVERFGKRRALAAAIVLAVAVPVGVALAIVGQGRHSNRSNHVATGVSAVSTTLPGTTVAGSRLGSPANDTPPPSTPEPPALPGTAVDGVVVAAGAAGLPPTWTASNGVAAPTPVQAQPPAVHPSGTTTTAPPLGTIALSPSTTTPPPPGTTTPPPISPPPSITTPTWIPHPTTTRPPRPPRTTAPPTAYPR